MVKLVTYKGPADAYLVAFRKDVSKATAAYQACFLIHKNETIALDDRDFDLIIRRDHIGVGQLNEVTK